MLDVCKTVYDTRLPTDLIKEIDILPSESSQDQIKELNIIVRALVQTTLPNYNATFNLNVSSITSIQEEADLDRKNRVKLYAHRQSSLIKNIRISNLSKEGSRISQTLARLNKEFINFVIIPVQRHDGDWHEP